MAAPQAWASEVFEAGRVEPVAVDGEEAWVNAGDTDGAARPEVLLLPYFDALAVGFEPRETLFPGRPPSVRSPVGRRATSRCCSSTVSCRASGTSAAPVARCTSRWRPGPTSPPTPTPSRRQVDRVGEVLEAVPDLTLAPVTVGPHA